MDRENEEMTNIEKNSFKQIDDDSFSKMNPSISGLELRIIEEFTEGDEESIARYTDEHLNEYNYYIFIYSYMKKFHNNYLNFVKKHIVQKIQIEKIEIGEMTEDVFEAKYFHIILLNALTQSMNISYLEFLRFCLKKEKQIPVPIIIKLLEKDDLDTIKEIVENKIGIFDIENCNFLQKQNFYADTYFYKLEEISDNIKIRHKNNYLTPKKLIYYAYKSNEISETKRETIIKDIIENFSMNTSDILTSIIKMRDQDLAK